MGNFLQLSPRAGGGCEAEASESATERRGGI